MGDMITQIGFREKLPILFPLVERSTEYDSASYTTFQNGFRGSS